MAETTFNSPLGAFELQRRPHTPQLPLQAWDAADEYLLNLAVENLSTATNALLINDQFGALALLAVKIPVLSWGDSFIAHLATQENLQRNQIDTAQLSLLPATQTPHEKQAASKKFALVLWRIPKNTHLLQQQIAALYDCVDENTLIYAAGMLKHLPAQAVDMLGALGEVEYLLAQKKARAFRIRPQLTQSRPAAAKTPLLQLREFHLQLQAGPNVFAHDKFDIGARFFLEQFKQLPRAEHIADLGCGNGVLGLRAKQLQPLAKIEFFDESYQAIAAAQANYVANGLSDVVPAAEFHVDDVFANYRGEPFDLILCNPPFHQGHVVGDHIAWQMLVQSKKNLRKGGEFWLVGNRHLDYHIKLKKAFGNCRQIAANSKFVVLCARAS